MDQICLDPQDKLPLHPPPLGHIVNKTPSPHRTKKCLRPPPEDNFWNSPKPSGLGPSAYDVSLQEEGLVRSPTALVQLVCPRFHPYSGCYNLQRRWRLTPNLLGLILTCLIWSAQLQHTNHKCHPVITRLVFGKCTPNLPTNADLSQDEHPCRETQDGHTRPPRICLLNFQSRLTH